MIFIRKWSHLNTRVTQTQKGPYRAGLRTRRVTFLVNTTTPCLKLLLTWHLYTSVWCDAEGRISQELATCCTSTWKYGLVRVSIDIDISKKSLSSLFFYRWNTCTCSSHQLCQCQRAADRSWGTRSWKSPPPCPPPLPAWLCLGLRRGSLATL